ncbi:hypothetical protein X743_34500 [Mesorhizobium sp. LNHC252B00]|uniref:hypothetical protein n=1 Tax=Mesorhizobium sp. LNHC252B00 TaxID=1287252 RepID=UPI0003CE353D|nr:hypothetical protein [Mesorhizobium sp. LNHC252B00]ESY62497.1 hypothetical protein X743_34500 [Mesorhizobium sp. LNHC252B00]
MTTDTPLTRYSATNGALASGFVTAELHHLMGHDPAFDEGAALVESLLPCARVAEVARRHGARRCQVYDWPERSDRKARLALL